MGVVIPFPAVSRAKSQTGQSLATIESIERAIVDAITAGADQQGVLAAARPLLDRCRDRYGFVVMRDGLPLDAPSLGRAMLALSQGLAMLDAAMAAPRSYPIFGVYLGRRELAWFEDGYSGETGLAVPSTAKASDIAEFVRPRITRATLRTGA